MKYIYMILMLICLITGVVQAQSAPTSIGGIKLGDTINNIKSIGYEVGLDQTCKIDYYDKKESLIEMLEIGKKYPVEVVIRGSNRSTSTGKHFHQSFKGLYGITSYRVWKKGMKQNGLRICIRGGKVFHMLKRTDENSEELFNEINDTLQQANQFEKVQLENKTHDGAVYIDTVYLNNDVTWILQRCWHDITAYDTKSLKQLLKKEKVGHERQQGDRKKKVDQAGPHNSKNLKIPENIRLLPQPAHSPELNPVEHVWDELREKALPNLAFKSLEEVEQSGGN